MAKAKNADLRIEGKEAASRTSPGKQRGMEVAIIAILSHCDEYHTSDLIDTVFEEGQIASLLEMARDSNTASNFSQAKNELIRLSILVEKRGVKTGAAKKRPQYVYSLRPGQQKACFVFLWDALGGEKEVGSVRHSSILSRFASSKYFSIWVESFIPSGLGKVWALLKALFVLSPSALHHVIGSHSDWRITKVLYEKWPDTIHLDCYIKIKGIHAGKIPVDDEHVFSDIYGLVVVDYKLGRAWIHAGDKLWENIFADVEVDLGGTKP